MRHWIAPTGLTILIAIVIAGAFNWQYAIGVLMAGLSVWVFFTSSNPLSSNSSWPYVSGLAAFKRSRRTSRHLAPQKDRGSER